jgi:hypothetical protein
MLEKQNNVDLFGTISIRLYNSMPVVMASHVMYNTSVSMKTFLNLGDIQSVPDKLGRLKCQVLSIAILFYNYLS